MSLVNLKVVLVYCLIGFGSFILCPTADAKLYQDYKTKKAVFYIQNETSYDVKYDIEKLCKVLLKDDKWEDGSSWKGIVKAGQEIFVMSSNEANIDYRNKAKDEYQSTVSLSTAIKCNLNEYYATIGIDYGTADLKCNFGYWGDDHRFSINCDPVNVEWRPSKEWDDALIYKDGSNRYWVYLSQQKDVSGYPTTRDMMIRITPPQ